MILKPLQDTPRLPMFLHLRDGPRHCSISPGQLVWKDISRSLRKPRSEFFEKVRASQTIRIAFLGAGYFRDHPRTIFLIQLHQRRDGFIMAFPIRRLRRSLNPSPAIVYLEIVHHQYDFQFELLFNFLAQSVRYRLSFGAIFGRCVGGCPEDGRADNQLNCRHEKDDLDCPKKFLSELHEVPLPVGIDVSSSPETTSFLRHHLLLFAQGSIIICKNSIDFPGLRLTRAVGIYGVTS